VTPPETLLLTIDALSAGTRLDVFLSGKIDGLSRSRLQTLVRECHVLLNSLPARPSHVLRTGDLVSARIPAESAPSAVAAEDIPLAILYEDADLVVLNKPAGLVVHPGAGNASGTVVNALIHHFGGLSVIGGIERPGIVHRLDKETSGCLLIAKSDSSQAAIAAQFAARQIEKTYLALVEGCPRIPHGEISAAITRHKVHRQKMTVSDRGRESFTAFRVLGTHNSLSLLECRPKTGRTHQIRVHLKHLGHPVVGDPLYGRRGPHTRHFLHAWKIAFTHPSTAKHVTFCAPLPDEFPAWTREAAVSANPSNARGKPARKQSDQGS